MVGVTWGQPALDSDWRPTGFVGHWGVKPQEASVPAEALLSVLLPIPLFLRHWVAGRMR